MNSISLKKTPFQIFVDRQRERRDSRINHTVDTPYRRADTMTSERHRHESPQSTQNRLFTNFQQEHGIQTVYNSFPKFQDSAQESFRATAPKGFTHRRIIRRSSMPSPLKQSRTSQSPKGKILGKDSNTTSLYERLIQYRNMDKNYPRLIIRQINPVLERIIEKRKMEPERPIIQVINYEPNMADNLDQDYHKLISVYESKYSPKRRFKDHIRTQKHQHENIFFRCPQACSSSPIAPWEQQQQN